MAVPKIRFPGFTDAWEQRKLGDVIEIESGMDYKSLNPGDIPVYGTGGYMLSVDKALSYERDAIGIGRKGTIDKPYILKAPFWTVDTLFYCIPKENYSLNFVHCIFQKINWKKKDESTGVPSLSKTIIKNIPEYFPSLSEQKKLGKFFSSLDDTITLHQRKLESMKLLKKSLLQKMFPKSGETVPEIRFPGFTAAWEQRRLSTISDKTFGGGTPKTSVEAYWNGTIPWIQSKDVNEDDVLSVIPQKRITEEAIANSATKLIPRNSIAIVTRVGVGKLAYMPFSYCTSQDFLSLSKLSINGMFATYAIYKMLQTAKHETQGTSIKGIPITEMLDKTIFVPYDTGEQETIGGFFKNIDQTITLHQRKVESLQKLKKSLLQHMFV